MNGIDDKELEIYCIIFKAQNFEGSSLSQARDTLVAWLSKT